MGKFDNNPFLGAENEIVKNEGKGKIVVSQTIGANIPQGKETKNKCHLCLHHRIRKRLVESLKGTT